MTRWARVVRGLAAAFVSTSVAAFSHLVAGGSLPGAAGLALCLAFCAIVCIALTGKRMSRLRLAASVATSQLMFHGLFSLLVAPAASGAIMVGHTHGGIVASQLAAVPTATQATHGGLGMLAGHLAAAVVTFLALSYGERAVWALFALGRLVIVRLLTARMPEPRPKGLSPVALRVLSLLPRVPRLLLSPMRHRGPPIASLA
jgi:hypothetical protein